MGWPECPSVELEYKIVRRVGHAVDFFEHDVALRLQITLPKKRPAHQIGQDLQGQRKIGIEDVCLIAGIVSPGEGVESPTSHLQLEGQLPSASALGALEHHVLEEMRDAELAGGLVRAGGADVNTDRGGADTREPLAKHHQAVPGGGAEQPLVEANRFHEELVPGQQRLPRQLHSAAVVDLQQFDLDDVALLDHILGLFGAAVLKLADVQQALDSGQDLDEGAERGGALDRALVRAAYLRLGGNSGHHGAGLFAGLAAHGGNGHHPVVVDADLGTGGILDAADGLSLGPDHVADLIGLDLHGEDPRGVLGQLGARSRQNFRHLLQNVQPASPSLLQGVLHDLEVEPLDLDIHLNGSDAPLRPGNLEVHVSEMVLRAQDVGQDSDFVALLDQPHCDTGAGGFHRNARVHQRE